MTAESKKTGKVTNYNHGRNSTNEKIRQV
ncbi:uncharacterized protein G2W53_035044 [Senna tora]|uniref:Uncharacterized protein n=1 Tax=Senna tora TaxID=362788 RepID=A0A834SRN4_9FABA|nr:uncharacterized protein G2W53_035044 [Senna tora]